jgi:hypothetical protein
VVEQWSGGVVEWWSGGVVEQWSGGAVERWSGVVEQWSGGAVDRDEINEPEKECREADEFNFENRQDAVVARCN